MSKQDKTITQKIADLEQMIAWFESEDFTPEQAVDKFTNAEKLATNIKIDLDNFKNEINVIKQKFSEGE